jgi:hypothetical protein
MGGLLVNNGFRLNETAQGMQALSGTAVKDKSGSVTPKEAAQAAETDNDGKLTDTERNNFATSLIDRKRSGQSGMSAGLVLVTGRARRAALVA